MKLVVIASVIGLTVITACAKEETVPPATPPGQQPYPQQQGAYPQQQPQQGYPQQQPQGQYPQQQPQGPAQGQQMATPGPLALPCQSDASCGLAKCNVPAQKCAFPCQSPVDCATGAQCNAVTGLCLPAMGQ